MNGKPRLKDGARDAAASRGSPMLKLHLPNTPALALGLAVDHLMGKPAFARLPFGNWARVLVGQINRKQCCFVIDRHNQVKGFAGWALTTRDKAEAWISGKEPLASRDSREGDSIIFNAWSADNPDVHNFMLAEFRKIFAEKRYVYFRRHYKDGRTRSARLKVHEATITDAALEAA